MLLGAGGISWELAGQRESSWQMTPWPWLHFSRCWFGTAGCWINSLNKLLDLGKGGREKKNDESDVHLPRR
jgi:hypothetical protein